MELFTQKILDKESLKQKPGASTKWKWFSKI